MKDIDRHSRAIVAIQDRLLKIEQKLARPATGEPVPGSNPPLVVSRVTPSAPTPGSTQVTLHEGTPPPQGGVRLDLDPRQCHLISEALRYFLEHSLPGDRADLFSAVKDLRSQLTQS